MSNLQLDLEAAGSNAAAGHDRPLTWASQLAY
jgi:hypothetical protein